MLELGAGEDDDAAATGLLDCVTRLDTVVCLGLDLPFDACFEAKASVKSAISCLTSFFSVSDKSANPKPIVSMIVCEW